MRYAIVWGLFFLLSMVPVRGLAQFSFDVSSVESYINDHKKQRSLLMARATLEYGNQLLHDYSKKQTVAYKDLNFDLDKYTRAFDIIDIMYQSLRLGMNVYNTYDNVSDRLKDYKKLLETFNERVIQRGRVELADTLLLTINRKAIEQITKEGEYLYKSVYDLVLYATGAAACSAADLIVVLENIENGLTHLRVLVNNAYFSTWRYVQLRIGYWKEKVYRTQTKQEMINNAFNRWRKAGINIKVN